jgi:hypothetical protein
MKVAAPPVMEADPDLQDAVIKPAHRRGRVAPQELERLVLFEELASVELLDSVEERFRRRVGAAGAGGLIGRAEWLPFWRARRLARAATWLGRARIR